MHFKYLFPTLFLFVFSIATAVAQTSDSLAVFDYSSQQEYEIGGIVVSGAEYSDENAIKSIAGLKVGGRIKIPGDDIPNALKSLWRLRLYDNVEILVEKTIGEIIFLEIVLRERPRLSMHSYKGVRKSIHTELNDLVNKYLLKGGIVTENIKTNAANEIKSYFVEKGYLDAEVGVEELSDEDATNSVSLVFNVNRKERIKIQDIRFVGNDNIPAKKLRSKMKKTRRKRKFLSTSKFLKSEYANDKKSVIAYYNTEGYRDASIAKDSIWRDEKGNLMVRLSVDEGNRYYFRNITWKGNSIYSTETLQQVLGITKGEVFNQELLETRLRFSMDGRDVSTLYMDNGYLFFNVDPAEVTVLEDSIDLEIRIFEGPQATIDRVVIKGNDRTH